MLSYYGRKTGCAWYTRCRVFGIFEVFGMSDLFSMFESFCVGSPRLAAAFAPEMYA
ncbi:hypothetical protein D3C78_1977890 [compost metagenome]